MKNSILLIGGVIAFLNTVIGLVASGYSGFNMVFADVSILISTGIIYYLFQSAIADGFKIGLGLVFFITGLIRFLSAVFSSEDFENNGAVIAFALILGVEAILLFVSAKLSKK
jgi:hypothetical protein